MKTFCFLYAAFLCLFITTIKTNAKNHVLEDRYVYIFDELRPLIYLLKMKGFKIKFDIQPKKGVYGLFQNKAKLCGFLLLHLS